MNNRDYISSIILQFSGQNNVIPIPVIYLKITEDYPSAALLNQMIYWSDRTNRKDGYFYKSYVEWFEELHLTEYQVRRATNKLKSFGFVETALKKANGAPTLHYKVDTKEVSEWILKKLKNGNLRNSRMDSEETQESLTEITTETNKHRETDDVSKSFKYISTNLEIIQNPLKAEQLEHEIKSFEKDQFEIVKVATDYCKENNKGLNYLLTVLKNWNKEGVSDKESAENKLKPRNSKKETTDDVIAQMEKELSDD
ncbi:TPA: DnaD domain protein [Staphylococcus aureus]